MKRNRFFKVMAAVVVLALLMLAIPLTPVFAESITPSAYSGYVGETVTITGSDYITGETYTITFAYGTSFSTVVASGAVSGTTFSRYFSVPTVPRGTYTIQVSGSISGTLNSYFEVEPQIVLDDYEGYVGDTVSVNGDGFLASSTVTIYYDGTNVGTKTANSYGTFDGFTFAVPASTEGLHDIDARDTSGYTPEVTFDVSPKIIISPTAGAVDDTVTVTGTGFDASSDIDIYFDSTVVSSAATTNSYGSFTAATFTVPETSRGSHTVKAKDEGANYATATFSVAQNISISPTSGPSGTVVTVTGNGFGSSKTITVKYNAVSVTTNPVSVTTNSLGYFTATFSVPVGSAGTYEVSVSDGTNTATANFISTTSATISQTTTTTAPGNVGMSLTITGVGFTPSHEVTITYSLATAESDTLATDTTDASGNFDVDFTIPASTAGTHIITVTDGTIVMSFDFVMESNPPPTPEPALPLADTKLKDRLFEWEAVLDSAPASNPVTYDFQIATDATFSSSSTLVSVTGLETAAYTLPDEEELESTGEDAPYYWRVRAVDAASNASAWSTGSTFTVGWSFEFTGWVVWVTMVVVAIVFFFVGLWLGRRGFGGGDYY